MKWLIRCGLVLLGLSGVVWAQSAPQKVILHSAQAGATATGNILNVKGYGSVMVQTVIASSWDGVLTYSVSVDGTNYTAVSCKPVASTTLTTTTSGADAVVVCPVAGAEFFKVPITSRTTGSVTVTAIYLYQTAGSLVNGGGGGGGVGDALTADPLSQFAITTSAQLATVLSNETGSGLAVFGTAPSFSDKSSFGTGDNLQYVVTTTPQLLDIRRGTAGAPDTTLNPLLKVSRTLSVTAGITADGAEELAAGVFFSTSVAPGTTQPVGVFADAYQVGASGDAVGVYGVGYTAATAAPSVGIGAFFLGGTQVSGGEANAVEAVVVNSTGSNVAWDSTDGRPSMSALWLNAFGANRSSAAINIGNSFAQQFDVGLGISGANGVLTTTIYDAGNATTSIRVGGSHVTGIQIDNGGGTTRSISNLSTTPSYFAGQIRVGLDSGLGQITSYTQDTGLTGALYGHHQVVSDAGGVARGVIGIASNNVNSASMTLGAGVAGQSGNAGDSNMGIQAGVYGEATREGGGGTTIDMASLYGAANSCNAGTCTRVSGLYLSPQTAGTTPHQIYSAGTALSYFAGPITLTSKLNVAGTAPTISGSCGTSPSIVGSDTAGKLTTGTVAPTSCTLTFAATWANAPSCIVTNETTANLARAVSTATTVVLSGTFVASDVLSYICIGRT